MTPGLVLIFIEFIATAISQKTYRFATAMPATLLHSSCVPDASRWFTCDNFIDKVTTNPLLITSLLPSFLTNYSIDQLA
jgi:hypothetical protein